MSSVAIIYQLFFLYIEPFSTILGAYHAWFNPHWYLDLTHHASAPSLYSVPVGTEVALRQLGNLYLAFTLNEALILRATSDLRVWRTLLLGLLIADFGHLYACYPLGTNYYYDFLNWNATGWGNIAFVYCGATLRTCFLLGIGVNDDGSKPNVGGPRRVRMEESVSRSVEPASPPRSTRRQKPANTVLDPSKF